MVVTTNLDKQNQTINFEMKKPNKWRSEDERVLTISNGKMMWIYDKQKNEVTKLALPEIKQPEFDYGKIVKDMVEKYNVRLVGEEKVSDRDCYVVELRPEGKDYFTNQKLWIDMEYWYPFKIEINYGNFSSTVDFYRHNLNCLRAQIQANFIFLRTNTFTRINTLIYAQVFRDFLKYEDNCRFAACASR